MSVNSTGDQNRSAGRDFNENHVQIGNFDGRHTINIAIPSEKAEQRPLVKAQRIELNRLVSAISDLGGGESYEIWQKLHAEIGVSGIEDMTVNQYHTSVSFLQALQERLKEKDSCRAITHLLLKNTPDSDLRQKLLRFCHFNFGTGRLNYLTLSQLQTALRWLEDQKVHDAKPPLQKNKLLISRYPKQIISLVFAAGVCAGFIIGTHFF
ncbi:membrane protein [Pluralibacter gergoviae]|uniref:membrane protein n=1 Tax=Pluralibacter gergoviae TaxID=61647 RepID=UPI0006509BA5|nr:membrane protein [Pluralibacter gergoviae]KMK28954.1 membrane protein [Pluralibacter gergoviae]